MLQFDFNCLVVCRKRKIWKTLIKCWGSNFANAITSEATVTFADARTSTIADAILERNPTDTQFTGNTSISSAAAALPALRGYGEGTDLQVAMINDATLLGLVDDVVALGSGVSLDTITADVPDILFRWAGVDGETPELMGQMMNSIRRNWRFWRLPLHMMH